MQKELAYKKTSAKVHTKVYLKCVFTSKFIRKCM